MAQRACTLTIAINNVTAIAGTPVVLTQTVNLQANASITPDQWITNARCNRGFWIGGDPTGVAAGSLWISWDQVLSITIS